VQGSGRAFVTLPGLRMVCLLALYQLAALVKDQHVMTPSRGSAGD
jgi:hypothetical protein